MKKLLLYLSALGSVLLASCSSDGDNENIPHSFVTISGNWELHVTASDSVSDSVISHPNRMIRMVWSDMSKDSASSVTAMNSQVTIGNSVWRFVTYVNGASAGVYNVEDSSFATYTYSTRPLSEDSLVVNRYALRGTVEWLQSVDDIYSDVNVDLVATDTAGSEVKISGVAKSALARPAKQLQPKKQQTDAQTQSDQAQPSQG